MTRWDKRLLGTWKSDRRLTFQNWKPSPKLRPSRVRKFRSLFGRLVMRWTRGKYYSDLDGFQDSGHYEILARDANSVVVQCWDSVPSRKLQTVEPELSIIFFEGTDTYRLPLRNGFCECFKRIE